MEGAASSPLAHPLQESSRGAAAMALGRQVPQQPNPQSWKLALGIWNATFLGVMGA